MPLNDFNFINNGLQPGAEANERRKPFQRFPSAGKPLKRLIQLMTPRTAKAGC
jgi:hypothetical protein